jgi:hypothetical protein
MITIFYNSKGMDKTIRLENHIIEAWGLWWVHWQKNTKERLQKHSMSPKVFVDKHLVTTEGESFLSHPTASSAITLVLLPK